jgi:hypothetical protein
LFVSRWAELIRKIELWTEIHELNDQGEYTPVEVIPKPEVLTGGVFQLRQGHSRRILVHVKPIQNSGTLPIICEAITSISVGCICARSKLQKGLDSYQEEDLNTLREKWSEALMRRREYLDEQIQKIINKKGKYCSGLVTGVIPLLFANDPKGIEWDAYHCSWAPLRPSDSDFSQNWKPGTGEIPLLSLWLGAIEAQ